MTKDPRRAEAEKIASEIVFAWHTGVAVTLNVGETEALLGTITEALLAAEERGARGAAAAITEFDANMDDIGSCGDGNCLVKKQHGMHTNGGCRCWQDKMRSQRFMLAARRLRNALPSPQEGE